ncbi:MAG: hypothetical protein VKJ06_01825 [Vampirovibrionales bacterium]|nr:hypothetical protein [Vampirovibrionales bacterium]
MTHLQDAQTLVWQQLQRPETFSAAVSAVFRTVEAARRADEAGQAHLVQSALEDTLAQVLCALKRLDVQAEAGLQRALQRLSKTRAKEDPGVIYLYTDRVELWLNHEYRGSWRIYDDKDIEQVRQMAAELGCHLQESGSNQLQLF